MHERGSDPRAGLEEIPEEKLLLSLGGGIPEVQPIPSSSQPGCITSSPQTGTG